MSPGINDPGTAVDEIAWFEKLLWDRAHQTPEDADPDYPQIFLPEVDPATLIESTFVGTARDRADTVEVVRRLLNALQDGLDPELAKAARDLATRTRAYADASLVLDHEKDIVAKD